MPQPSRFTYLHPYHLQIQSLEAEVDRHIRFRTDQAAHFNSMKEQLKQERKECDMLKGRYNECKDIIQDMDEWKADMEVINQQQEERIQDSIREYQNLLDTYQELKYISSGQTHVQNQQHRTGRVGRQSSVRAEPQSYWKAEPQSLVQEKGKLQAHVDHQSPTQLRQKSPVQAVHKLLGQSKE